MRYCWPEDTVFEKAELEPEDRNCPFCERWMHLCDHRHHKIFTFSAPVHIVSKLTHCPDKDCTGHYKTFSPDAEMSLTMPRWLIGWDVFAWIGHRRFARHWSVPQIHNELLDTYQIVLSETSIERYIYRYQTMLAARQQNPQILADEYRDVKDLILSIDGLQPEKGHETLYVVRELRRKRVWFAESLISSSGAEVRQIIAQAREWAQRLGLSVRLWISDKQDAFVKGVAAEFPDVPHRYCENHFLRDMAKPVLEADSRAKVTMRRRVRGLRAIEREVLEERRKQAVSTHTPESQNLESEMLKPRWAQAAYAEDPGHEAVEQDVVQACCEQANFTDTSESQKLESQEPKPPCEQTVCPKNPGAEAVERDVAQGRCEQADSTDILESQNLESEVLEPRCAQATCAQNPGPEAVEQDVAQKRCEQANFTDTSESQKLESQEPKPPCEQTVCPKNPGAEAVERDVAQECCERAGLTDTSESQKLEPQAPKPPCAQSNCAKDPQPEAVEQDVGLEHRPKNTSTEKIEVTDVVLDYCTAVRGILNGNQGGPLDPPGLRLAEALREVRASLQRNLEVKKGALTKRVCDDSPAVSTVASCWSKPSKSN